LAAAEPATCAAAGTVTMADAGAGHNGALAFFAAARHLLALIRMAG
jgi:hypothetical protein